VWLALVLTLVLAAGCADEGAAEDVSEATTAAAPPDTAAGTASEVGGLPTELDGLPTELGGAMEEDPDVVAVCDQFFNDVSRLAEAGEPDAMLEAVRSWSEQAQGTAIENEATAIADMLTEVASGDFSALDEELVSASTEFGTQCAMHGWVPSR
jgi:hypothetical protein